MKLAKHLFDFVIFIQICMFIVFLLLNFYNLDEITIAYELDEEVEEYSFNFYTVLGLLLAIMLLGVLTSFGLFGGGLNEEGSKLLMRYLALVLLIALMFIVSSYFLLLLGVFGVICNLIFIIAYVLKVLDLMLGVSEQNG